MLLDAFEALSEEGVEFELHLVGRVNPHFGGPLSDRVKAIAARIPGLRHHAHMGDEELVALLGSARATAICADSNCAPSITSAQ